jgi:hypothetical protein
MAPKRVLDSCDGEHLSAREGKQDTGFYADHVLPYLINLTMRNSYLVPYRERVIAGAEGRVLEIGIGSGLNLPFYSGQVREILGLEPAPRLIAMARRSAHRSSFRRYDPLIYTNSLGIDLSINRKNRVLRAPATTDAYDSAEHGPERGVPCTLAPRRAGTQRSAMSGRPWR